VLSPLTTPKSGLWKAHFSNNHSLEECREEYLLPARVELFGDLLLALGITIPFLFELEDTLSVPSSI